MKRDTPRYIVSLAKELRLRQTEAESLLWKHLRNNKLKGYKFRRQYPIGRCIADFYCIKKRLLIELDGGIHVQLERKEYDLIRQRELESRKIKVLRLQNDEVINNLDSVLKRITEELAPLSSLGEGLG